MCFISLSNIVQISVIPNLLSDIVPLNKWMYYAFISLPIIESPSFFKNKTHSEFEIYVKSIWKMTLFYLELHNMSFILILFFSWCSCGVYSIIRSFNSVDHYFGHGICCVSCLVHPMWGPCHESPWQFQIEKLTNTCWFGELTK